MTRHSYPYVPAAVAILLTAACGTTGTGRPVAATASAPSSPAPRPGTVSSGDRAWLAMAHQADLTEVQTGRLAGKKGGSQAIRRAGDMLVADHTRFDADVTKVAQSLDVELPRTAGADHIAVIQRLDKESGSRFDRDFVDAMIAGHKKVIAGTEAEVRDGSAPAVKNLARAALPTLHKHLSTLEKASPTS